MARSRPAAPRTPRHFVVGAREVARAVDAGAVRRVLVALDAPPEATAAVRSSAAARHVDVLAVSSAAELGRHCGIPRPVAAVGELCVPLVRTAQASVGAGR